jgi:hypothetical protein
MNFDDLYNVLFSYSNYERITLDVNKRKFEDGYRGVLTMIPSIAITAYILDLDYENIKDFYYKNLSWCEKYEAYFRKDYERYLNILSTIKNSSIISVLLNKYEDSFFEVNVDKPLSYDRFINEYVCNILRYKDIIVEKTFIGNFLYYNIDFVFGVNIEPEMENNIKNIIKKVKHDNKDIFDVGILISANKNMYTNIYMKPSFNIIDFIKLIDKLKISYQKNLKHSI